MILGYSLGEFLAVWLPIMFLTTIVSLSPFLVKRFYPQAYHGLWKTAGDLLKTPTRALMYPLGILLGIFLVIAFFYGREITPDEAQTLSILGLGLLVIFLAIIFSIRLIRLEQSNQDADSNGPQ